MIHKLIRKYKLDFLLNTKGGRKSDSLKTGRHNPARIIKSLIEGGGIVYSDEIWSNLECIRVSDGKADFAGFIRDIRAEARKAGFTDTPLYGGAMRIVASMLASKPLKQNRLGWLTPEMKVVSKGDYLLFIGDLPYYEDIFGHELNYSPLDTVRSALKLLNAIGIKPVLMKEEVPSGIDELWSGDTDTFNRLAEKNIKAIKRTGAKKIIVLDSESLHALKTEYKRLKGFKTPVFHISEILAKNAGKLSFGKIDEKTAYHDPCRFIQAGITTTPGTLLSLMLKNKIVRTPHEGENTLCPGGHTLANLDAGTKEIQLQILREAEKAGAEILVTPCPREALILRLAVKAESWKQTNINIRELTVLAADLYNAEA